MTAEAISNYHVLRTLAKGKTTDVMLASQGREGEREVVLEILREPYANDPVFAERFVTAANAWVRLTHPSIVTAHHLLSVSRHPVLVLDYVEGIPLSRLREVLVERLDDIATCHIAAEVFSALETAHAARDDAGARAPVLHRYMNPADVLIAWDGRVSVCNFGLPQPKGNDAGIAEGVDGYRAPELENDDEPSSAVDVYSAGIILLEMLTHEPAVRPDGKTSSAAQLLRLMDSLRPNLDSNIRDIVRRALEPEVRKRATAADVVEVLRARVTVEDGSEWLAGLMDVARRSAAAEEHPSQPQQVQAKASGVRPPPPVPQKKPGIPPRKMAPTG